MKKTKFETADDLLNDVYKSIHDKVLRTLEPHLDLKEISDLRHYINKVMLKTFAAKVMLTMSQSELFEILHEASIQADLGYEVDGNEAKAAPMHPSEWS